MILKYIIGLVFCLAILVSGILGTTFSPLGHSCSLVLLGVGCVLSLFKLSNTRSTYHRSLVATVCITLLYLLTRAYFSPVKALATQDLIAITSAIFVYITFVVFLPSRIVCKFVFVGLALVMLLNLVNLIPKVDSWRDTTLNFANGAPNTGLFNNRSMFGCFMSLATIFSLSISLFMRGSVLSRGLLGLFSVLGVAAVVISTSRASFMSLVIGVIVVLFSFWVSKIVSRNNYNKKQLALSSFTALIVLLSVVFGFSRHIMKERGVDLDYANGRLAYFAISLDQVPDAPFTGSGSRSVEYKSYENWPLSMRSHEKDFKFTHNEYIQSVTDYGLIGGGLLLVVFVWHIVLGVRKFVQLLVSDQRDYLPQLLGSVAVLIALSFHMLLSFSLHGYLSMILVVFACAIIVITPCSRSNKESRNVFLIGGAVLLVILSLAYLVVEGSRENRAAMKYWAHGIIVDDLNWSLSDTTNSQWEAALQEVIKVAPNYHRYNKLGLIYLHQQKLTKAKNCFEKSKILHPFDPISRLNLADILTRQDRFKEAETEYLATENLVKNRENNFQFYRNVAELYTVWAINEPMLQLELIEKAYLACLKSREKSKGYMYPELRRTIQRVLLLKYYYFVKNNQYVKACKVFDELVIVYRSAQIKTDEDAETILNHGKELVRHARLAYSHGDLKRAAKATYRAKVTYHRYLAAKKGVVDEQWRQDEARINQALGEFQQAGVKIDKN